MSHIVIGENVVTNKTVRLDVDLVLRTRLLIQGGSGSGKSWLLRRLAEQLFGKLPVIIIDPEGEFATLREQFGYVLVGQGGETPADIRSAGLVAHKLLELHASAVCDIYEMKPDLRHQWVKLFLEALIDAPKALWQPAVVIVDEAHMFCPEKGAGESDASDAMIALTTRGRKRGFTPVFATQRLGKLRKDAAAELQNVVIGRTFIDIDRKRAIDTLGVAKDETDDFSHALKTLDEGQFWSFGPAITLERALVKVGAVITTHPKLGSSKHAAEPPPAPDKVKALLPKLADLPQQAEKKALTEKELRTQLAEKDRRIRELEKFTPMSAVIRSAPDKPILTDADRELLKSVRAEFATFSENITDKADVMLLSLADRAKAAIDEACLIWTNDVDKRRALFIERLEKTRVQKVFEKVLSVQAPDATAFPRRNYSEVIPTRATQERNPRLQPRSSGAASVAGRSSNGARPAVVADGDLSKGERVVLTALAQYRGGLTREQLSVLCGYKKSTRDLYLQQLGRRQAIDVSGDVVIATPDGVNLLGDFEPLPTGQALVEFWRRRLPAGERAVLDVLVEANGQFVDRDVLSERTGYRKSTRDLYVQLLTRRKLATSGRDGVRASEALFE